MRTWLSTLCGLLLTHGAYAKIVPTYDPAHPHRHQAPHKLTPESLLTQLKGTEIADLQKARPTERQQTLCLALGLYHEARSETQEGQRAVGHVILNRVKATGQTICQTVWAHRQFAPTIGRTPKETEAWKAVQQQAVALRTDPGFDNSGGATFFYNFKLAHPSWANGLVTAQYGYHIFIRRGRELNEPAE
jgi:spore germination cell wall hydrolase CwlJ-like protein